MSFDVSRYNSLNVILYLILCSGCLGIGFDEANKNSAFFFVIIGDCQVNNARISALTGLHHILYNLCTSVSQIFLFCMQISLENRAELKHISKRRKRKKHR
jgi:hypothetical protein